MLLSTTSAQAVAQSIVASHTELTTDHPTLTLGPCDLALFEAASNFLALPAPLRINIEELLLVIAALGSKSRLNFR